MQRAGGTGGGKSHEISGSMSRSVKADGLRPDLTGYTERKKKGFTQGSGSWELALENFGARPGRTGGQVNPELNYGTKGPEKKKSWAGRGKGTAELASI